MFTVRVNLDKIVLADNDGDTVAGYTAWEARLNWSAGLLEKDRPLAGEVVDPACPAGAEANGPGNTELVGCLESLMFPGESTLVGVAMAEWDFNCSSSGKRVLTLVHGPALDTYIQDDAFTIFANDSSGASESIVLNCGLPTVFDQPPTPTCGTTINGSVGSNTSFKVQASDGDGEAVTLFASGLPSGTTMTPGLPTIGNPVSSMFSWTPTAGQTGTHVVSFYADSGTSSALCSITINVPAAPIDLTGNWVTNLYGAVTGTCDATFEQIGTALTLNVLTCTGTAPACHTASGTIDPQTGDFTLVGLGTATGTASPDSNSISGTYTSPVGSGTFDGSRVGTTPPPCTPIINLTPETDTNPRTATHVVTATVTDGGSPVPDGTQVRFQVTGDNPVGPTIRTTTGGVATFDYVGMATGNDTIRATLVSDPSVFDTATKTWVAVPHAGKIDAVAGGATGATSVALGPTNGVARGFDGSVYVAEVNDCRVRRISPTGAISTVAGTGVCGPTNGENIPATTAQLNNPVDLATDGSGNLYIADRLNHRVRRVSPTGFITTIAGNGSAGSCTDGAPATGSCLNEPIGLWSNATGSTIYVANFAGHRVVSISSGQITNLAGNGTAGSCSNGSSALGACLDHPEDVVNDGAGNTYITDTWAHKVQRVTGGLITTVAGNGSSTGCSDGSPATGPCLYYPAAIELDGGNVYVTDASDRVHRIDGSGNIYLAAGGGPPSFCGDGGPATSACLFDPFGLDFGPGGTFYIGDANNQRVRVVQGGIINTYAGGSGSNFCGDTAPAVGESCLDTPGDVVADANGNIYIADTANGRVRRVAPSGTITTYAGGNSGCGPGVGDGGQASAACLVAPEHLALLGSNLFISDRGDHRVRVVNLITNQIFTVAGDGTAAGSQCTADVSATGSCLNQPTGIATQQVGADIYVFVGQAGLDGYVSRVRIPSVGTNTIRTVFDEDIVPADVTLEYDLKHLYVAEPSLGRVRRMHTDDGLVDGGEAISNAIDGLNGALGIHSDKDGHLLIADTDAHQLRAVEPGSDGFVDGDPDEDIVAFAGTGTPGFCGDNGPSLSACLNAPSDVYFVEASGSVDTAGSLYFVDQGNERVRKIPADSDGDGILDVVEDANGNGYEPGVETDKENTDTDGDGCSDSEELGPVPSLGGTRNPKELGGFWDFFDTPTPPLFVPDRAVSVADISAVVARFGSSRPGGPPDKATALAEAQTPPPAAAAYHVGYDRTLAPPFTGPPNGSVTVQDISLAVQQFGHNCLAPP
jgi:hypothetical protein